jgi:hypothetical protein
MAIHDLKSFRVDTHEFVARHTEGAKAAILGSYGRLFVETRLVFPPRRNNRWRRYERSLTHLPLLVCSR